LQRFLLARRATPEEAEDILQDLFLKLGKVRSGPIADPLAYLYRIADNLLLDIRRSHARRSVREQAWTAVRTGGGEIDDQPSAEDRLIGRERLDQVRRALSGLPDRTVLILRCFRLDGMPQKDIAADLGISVSAVEKHLQRAYRTLLEARVEPDADMVKRRRPTSEGD
jgi:RNA polymerase sigma-70 factor (ECF subfamily)